MNSLRTILTVAKYEARILKRSWFFKLFFIMGILICTYVNLGVFSPIGNQAWDFIALSSTIPYLNLYILNIAQSIIVIFLAADFLKRDKKVDTNEVLYTRSMSNLEYVLGKTWGITRLFLGLNILILVIGLIINIINPIIDVDIQAYFEYLCLISIPTLIFSLGMAFMLMIIIKNQAITFLILLGLAAADIFWGYFRLGGLLDYMAFGLPMFKSTIVGFDNLSIIVCQRAMYLSLGLALIFSTVLLFNRLRQSKIHTTLSCILVISFLVIAFFCGRNVLTGFLHKENSRTLVLETNKKYENQLFVAVTNVDIDVNHLGNRFEASATVKFINDNLTDIDNYIFSLNPGLTVTRVTSAGKQKQFTAESHIIKVTTDKPLRPNETDSLTFVYHGTIDETFCYPDFIDNPKDNPYRIEFLNINKRQAFVEANYVLLTPETHWYPVAGLNFFPSNPARLKIDFADYSLRVHTLNNLTAVSQGKAEFDGESYSFKPATPLTGLTLAIGNYKTDTITVDSVTYINNYLEGHDYYKSSLSEIADTLPTLITGFMRDLEIQFTTSYPFPTLGFVEVPIQFYSFPRMGTQTRAELQPSMILVPERLVTMQNAGFDARFKQQKRRMERNNEIITDKELKVRLFNNFVTNSFISGNEYQYVNGVPVNEPTRYRLGPSFYFFKNNFYSNDFPVINAVFENHLQKLEMPEETESFGGGTTNITSNDQANMIFKDISFANLLRKDPLGDTLNNAITLKGDYLFSIFRAKGGIDEFNKWFKEYIDANKFNRISIDQLNNDMNERFGFEFKQYLNDWFNEANQPGFRFANMQVSEVVADNRIRYQVKFVAWNPESVSGIFNISFTNNEGGTQQGDQETGRGMESANLEKIVFLEPNEVKEIGIVLDVLPRSMIINTLFSKNIPGRISFPIVTIASAQKSGKEFIGERVLPTFPEQEEEGVIVIDNEDKDFSVTEVKEESLLRNLLNIKRERPLYDELMTYNWAIPIYWQSVLQNTYYGKYVMSAIYTKAGNGNREISWTADITEAGYYEIYCYVGKAVETTRRQSVTGGSSAGSSGSTTTIGSGNASITIVVGDGGTSSDEENNLYKDMHYTVYHDDGSDEIVFDYGGAAGGWNSFGKFYLSKGKTKVTLSNLSSGSIVIGDAIKWLKID